MTMTRDALQTAEASLDETDRQVLRLLATDGRMSVRRVASKIQLSPPSTAARIRRLERDGVIAAYHAEINWRRLGYQLIAYVQVVCMQAVEQSETVARLLCLPEVERVDLTTGNADLLVRLCLKSPDHLRRVLLDKVWRIPGVQRTETIVSLQSYCSADDGLLAIDALQTDALAPSVVPPTSGHHVGNGERLKN